MAGFFVLYPESPIDLDSPCLSQSIQSGWIGTHPYQGFYSLPVTPKNFLGEAGVPKGGDFERLV